MFFPNDRLFCGPLAVVTISWAPVFRFSEAGRSRFSIVIKRPLCRICGLWLRGFCHVVSFVPVVPVAGGAGIGIQWVNTPACSKTGVPSFGAVSIDCHCAAFASDMARWMMAASSRHSSWSWPSRPTRPSISSAARTAIAPAGDGVVLMGLWVVNVQGCGRALRER